MKQNILIGFVAKLRVLSIFNQDDSAAAPQLYPIYYGCFSFWINICNHLALNRLPAKAGDSVSAV
jgi:hypothetical protein